MNWNLKQIVLAALVVAVPTIIMFSVQTSTEERFTRLQERNVAKQKEVDAHLTKKMEEVLRSFSEVTTKQEIDSLKVQAQLQETIANLRREVNELQKQQNDELKKLVELTLKKSAGDKADVGQDFSPVMLMGQNLLVPFMMNMGGNQYNFIGSDGKFNLTQDIRKVMIDIGAHQKTELIEPLNNDATTFGIAFEPTPYNFLRNPSHPRLLVLPYAVSPHEGFTNFYVSPYDECNSLLPQSADATPLLTQAHSIDCVKTQQKITVPTVKLSTILKMIPEPLEVTSLKIDAQGFDVEVAKSAGTEQIRRVQRLVLECQDLPPDSQLLLYKGAGTKADAVKYMNSVGFELEGCNINNDMVKELNCIFVRKP